MSTADEAIGGLLVDLHDLLLGAIALIDQCEYRDRDDGLLAARRLVRLALDRTVAAQALDSNP
jgi:hypothetical protein